MKEPLNPETELDPFFFELSDSFPFQERQKGSVLNITPKGGFQITSLWKLRPRHKIYSAVRDAEDPVLPSDHPSCNLLSSSIGLDGLNFLMLN